MHACKLVETPRCEKLEKTGRVTEGRGRKDQARHSVGRDSSAVRYFFFFVYSIRAHSYCMNVITCNRR